MDTSDLPALLEFFKATLPALRVTKGLNAACLCLAVYEYWITLDDEVRCFWNGPWTVSRVLFFLNRYMLPLVTAYVVFCDTITMPSQSVCGFTFRFAFYTEVIASGIVQAILVVRVWYLFSENRAAQMTIYLAFVASFITSMYFMHVSAKDLQLLPNFRDIVEYRQGCKASRPHKFGRVYIPPLVLHTLLYAMTAYCALRNRRLLKEAPIVKRLVRDGGFFLLVVFVTVGFTTVGSFLTDVLTINLPSIFTPFLLTTTSIAVSRVMFSIHSLASNLGSNSGWLLNGLELRRAGWRQGSREGELIVERMTDDLVEEYNGSDVKLRSQITRSPGIRVTRVGELEQRVWVKGYLR
ncbi:hypothetical protein BDN72DRAFT_159157 [Pluteus cervinus]|uniref:Uncharacterized protein n=1 Tax=Pluteus cervinus TaxID=181527 RepID=A0ACD3AKG6_9AGAR|nr:hypothetical protein BDN72DRAFT_159157 [Pluteus cervinus]